MGDHHHGHRFQSLFEYLLPLHSPSGRFSLFRVHNFPLLSWILLRISNFILKLILCNLHFKLNLILPPQNWHWLLLSIHSAPSRFLFFVRPGTSHQCILGKRTWERQIVIIIIIVKIIITWSLYLHRNTISVTYTSVRYTKLKQVRKLMSDEPFHIYCVKLKM